MMQHLPFIQKFILFIRTQGVIGLAVAVVLGGATQRVVSALVDSFITPLIGLLLGPGKDLADATFTVRDSVFAWGNFVSTVLDFLIIAFVIYMLVKVLNVGMLDKPKQ